MKVVLGALSYSLGVVEKRAVGERIGFIGLGAMGRPMATRLLEAGYDLNVYARRAEAMQPLCSLGARFCISPQDVALHSDVVITMVTATADVAEVVFGGDGIVHGAAAGSMLIDMSTISPVAVRDFARLHHKALHVVLDLAYDLGITLPAARVTTQSFDALIASGGGREDSAALIRVIEGAG